MEALLDERDATFEEHRGLLFGVAYRMLGSVAAAEDAVQDAYLRFRNSATAAANPRAFLITVVTRLCLDELKSARTRREQYIGPWLPEPLVRLPGDAPSPEDMVERIGTSDPSCFASHDDRHLGFVIEAPVGNHRQLDRPGRIRQAAARLHEEAELGGGAGTARHRATHLRPVRRIVERSCQEVPRSRRGAPEHNGRECDIGRPCPTLLDLRAHVGPA